MRMSIICVFVLFYKGISQLEYFLSVHLYFGIFLVAKQYTVKLGYNVIKGTQYVVSL
jgi:hypothetical protein